MTKIVAYTKKGEKRYKFQAYLGINKTTQKRVMVSRSGFHSQREAKIALERLHYQFEHSTAFSSANITYREVYELFIKAYAATVTESTLNRVLGIFRLHVLDAIGDRKIKSLDMLACQYLIDDLSEHIKDIRKVGNYVGMVFNYAIKLDLIAKNPMQFVTYPQRVHRQNDNFWNKKQLQQFLNILDKEYSHQPKMQMYLRLAAVSGARKAELLALQVNNVDYENNCITINKTITKGLDNSQKIGKTKTVNSNRTLYLDDKTMQMLGKWQKQLRLNLHILGFDTLKPDQLLFPNTRNEMLSLMKPNKWLASVINKYDLKPISPHGLRSTVATLLSQAGASLKEMQLQLGDTDIDVLLTHYVKLDNQMKQETTRKLSEFVGF